MQKNYQPVLLRILAWVPVVLCWYLLVPVLHWPIRWFLSGMALLGVPEFIDIGAANLRF